MYHRKINIKAILSDIINSFYFTCAACFTMLVLSSTEVSLDIIRKLIQHIYPLVLFGLLTGFIVALFLGREHKWLSGEKIGTTSAAERPMGTAVEFNNSNIKYSYAIHEAGHALAAYLLDIQNFSVYMTGANPCISYEWILDDEESLKTSILISYAGAAAEELVCGKYSFGAMNGNGSDFVSAVEYIKGYLVLTGSISKTFLDNELDKKVNTLSDGFFKEVKELLKDNQESLTIIAEELLKKHSLDRKQIDKILQK